MGDPFFSQESIVVTMTRLLTFIHCNCMWNVEGHVIHILFTPFITFFQYPVALYYFVCFCFACVSFLCENIVLPFQVEYYKCTQTILVVYSVINIWSVKHSCSFLGTLHTLITYLLPLFSDFFVCLLCDTLSTLYPSFSSQS